MPQVTSIAARVYWRMSYQPPTLQPFARLDALDRVCAAFAYISAMVSLLYAVLISKALASARGNMFERPVGPHDSIVTLTPIILVALLIVLVVVFCLAGFGLSNGERRGFLFGAVGFGVTLLLPLTSGLAFLSLAVLAYCVLRMTGNLGALPK